MSYRLGAPLLGRLCAVSARQNPNGVRWASTGGGRLNYTQVPKYLLEKMKLFQLPNNLPVHVKGGSVDKILYVFTSLVCTVGLIECFRVYYVLSYPQAKQD